MNRKPIFILGMRRSGTSILRELILKHPKVEWIDFEPHEFFFVIESIGINRYKRSEYHKKVIERYSGHPDYYTGNKIAVNCGLEALRWKRIEENFDKPFYIFIKRNIKDTYNSWIKNETSVRGIVPFEMYEPWYNHINKSFSDFYYENSDRSRLITYEHLIKNADKELETVWDMLDIPILNNLNRFVKLPNNVRGLK